MIDVYPELKYYICLHIQGFSGFLDGIYILLIKYLNIA